MMRISVLAGIQVFLFLLIFPKHSYAQSYTLPSLTVDTQVSKTTLYGDDEASVIVQIDGDKIAQTQRVPVDLVFILDTSGSMKGSIGELKAATISLINQLDSGQDRVSLVTFSSTVELKTPLTNDLSRVRQLVNSLGAGGQTNLAGGIKVGASQLVSASHRQPIGILFTDGYPVPDPNGQKTQIILTLKEASGHGIALHTVGMSNVDQILLKFIADRTGGSSHLINSGSEIRRTFAEIFDTHTNFLSTRSVKITESLHDRIRPSDGSYSSSNFPTSGDVKEFKKWESDDVPSFYKTAELEFPLIPEITDKNFFSFRYKIHANDCTDTDELVPLRSSKAKITYQNGSHSTQTLNLSANSPSQIKIPKCGVYVFKKWNETESSLEIELINSFAYTVRDIKIEDQVHDCWVLDKSKEKSFDPSGFLIPSGQRIVWPTKISSTKYMPPKSRRKFLFHVKPGDGYSKISRVHNPQGHSYDDTVRFNYQKPIFRIASSEIGFEELKRDLRKRSKLSPRAKSLIEKKLGHGLTLPATVTPTLTNGYASDIADYAFIVPINQIRRIPPPPTKAHIIDFYTGVLYFRINNDLKELNVFIEYRDELEIPGVSTSSEYEGPLCPH